MSYTHGGTPRPLAAPVAQRHLKAEVATCVGGVISPVLMNVALHGMEQAAGVRYITTGSNAGTARPGSPC